MAEIPADCEQLVRGAREMAHVATSRDDRPHVAPVWYRYEDGEIEIVTTGRKLANLRSNPRVAVSIEQSAGGNPDWSVTMLGTATVVDDDAATATANRRINRKYGVPEDAWAVENTLVRIDVASTTVQRYDDS